MNYRKVESRRAISLLSRGVRVPDAVGLGGVFEPWRAWKGVKNIPSKF
jgi:hypothetical protein